MQYVLALWMLLAPMQSYAESTPQLKDPMSYPLKQYGFMLAISLLGGVVGWWARVRKGELEGWNIQQLIGELATSAFSGLIAFWGCEYMNAPAIVTPAVVGIAGHMGTRGITVLEDVLKMWLTRKAEKNSA